MNAIKIIQAFANYSLVIYHREAGLTAANRKYWGHCGLLVTQTKLAVGSLYASE